MNATSIFGKEFVTYTPEIERVARLPRRVWSEQEGLALAADMTRELKTPQGTMSLRPVQAIGLYEAMQVRGLFAPQRVGSGKTIETLLLPLVLQARQPVLLLPAGLIEKTCVDWKMLAEHWRLPTNLQMISYEMLGLVQSVETLNYIRPDLIISDECHKLKNNKAGRTKRISRYMHENPQTMFCALSGTIMKGSITDFAPLLRWSLKANAPVPMTVEETDKWAEALDEGVNPLQRRRPGALEALACPPRAIVTLPAVRQVFQERLLQTRGVVASEKNDGVTCSLVIRALEYKPSKLTEAHVRHLRNTWTTPDGWPFIEALEFRRYMRELSLGFHGVWDPRPPDSWLTPRKVWASWVRDILSHSRTLDTEFQVVHAVEGREIEGLNGWWKPKKLDDGGRLAAWRAVRDTFTIQPKPIWHDDSALLAAAEWMKENKGIVWTEHQFFARRLSEMTGCSYYGADGVNERRESITLVKPGRAIIASIAANGTGRNLQMFSKNLIVSCPPGSLTLEQLIGRTHRPGQEADEVTVDILLGCREHFEAFERALEGARATADTIGHDQKLLLSTIVFPVSVDDRRGGVDANGNSLTPLWD